MTAKRSSDAPPAAGHYRTRALLRGLSLLSCFTPTSPERSLAELAADTGLDKATALRLLTCLVEAGFLRRNLERGTYQVGPAVLELASAFHAASALGTLAEPQLRHLAQATGQTATLAILDGDESVTVALAFSDRPLRRQTHVGDRYQLHCSSVGKAIAAYLGESELEAMFGERGFARMTSKTIVTWPEFQAELQRVRETGYALDDEEAIEGVSCVGAVIRDYARRPVAAVSIAGPAGEFVGEAVESCIAEVKQAASTISGLLGYVPETLSAVS